jgi:hypothetical protein
VRVTLFAGVATFFCFLAACLTEVSAFGFLDATGDILAGLNY